jgi:predicted permease
MMRRAPIFTAIAVLSLAMGIGATTTVFTLVNSLMFRTLPVREPGQLVELLSRYPGEPRMNFFWWRFFEHYRDGNHVFSDLFGFSPASLKVATESGEAEPVVGEYVTGRFFPALGIQPAIGRLIEPSDDRLGAGDPAVAVVSWSYWETRWQLSPSIVGSRVVVEGVPATVIGVAPRGFSGLLPGRSPRLWLPAAMEPLIQRPGRRASGQLGLGLVGRLAPGVTIEQARAEMRLLDRARVEELGTGDPQWRLVEIDLQPAGAGLSVLRDQIGRPLLALMAIVAVLLLIACTNVASMLLARATARRREMAVRVALGAGRLRLLQQLLTESMLLTAAGGAIGVLLASIGAGALARSWPLDPRIRGRVEIPVHFDVPVLLFTAAIVLVTAILFGLAPAWNVFAQDGSPTLRQSGVTSETRSRRLFGKSLIVAQVALSVVLLSAAGLFIGEVLALRNRDLGFDRRSVMLMTLDPSKSGYTGEQLSPLYEDVLTRLKAIPGVEAATLCAVSPIQGGAALRFVTVDGFTEQGAARRYVSLNWVAPDYFRVVRTPLVAGRDFTPPDAHGPRVAIVNQAFARYYFGESTPIGRQFAFDGRRDRYEIVGVAGDAKYSTLHEPPPRTIYLNAFQDERGRVSQFALRTTGRPSALAAEARRVASEVSKTVAVARITTLSEQVDASLLPERLMARLSSTFGAFGAGLAAMGIYGLLAFTVTRRTGEIALHMALGATRGDALLMVIKSASSLVAAGVAIGVPLALWSRRVTASVIQLSGDSTVPIAASAAAMIAVALLAAYVPARRAARVEPMQALRHE